MIGATLTCPMEVVKTRMQSKALSHQGGMITVFKTIATNEGAVGFWKVPARETPIEYRNCREECLEIHVHSFY